MSSKESNLTRWKIHRIFRIEFYNQKWIFNGILLFFEEEDLILLLVDMQKKM